MAAAPIGSGGTGVKVDVRPSAESCAAAAAAVLATALGSGRRIGLATGNTFVPVYERVVAEQPVTASADLYLLDEYLGLERGDPASFRQTLERLLCRPLGLADGRLRGPLDEPGAELDPERWARRYDELVGTLDLVLLGIGTNGHVAFNEPGAPLTSTTRVVRLSDETRRANAGAFPGRPVPTRAVTMGIATILRARRLVLVATGAHKAGALAAAVAGPVDPGIPASALQTHPHALVLADPDAARLVRASTTPEEEP